MAADHVYDRVTLVKRNGRRYPDIPAIVRSERIFIEDGKLPIEEGDGLIQHLTGGGEQEFVVTVRGYCQAIATFPAHYQCVVKRTGSGAGMNAAGLSTPSSGSSPSVVQPSAFNTVFLPNAPAEIFEQLRSLIQAGVPAPDQARLLQAVNSLEQAQGSPDFVHFYKAFMATAAHHISMLAPALPALSQLLY